MDDWIIMLEKDVSKKEINKNKEKDEKNKVNNQ